MDTETPSPTPSPEPAPASPRRRGSVLGGALLGAVALTASVVGVSAIAGAQDDTGVDQDETVEAVELEELSDEDLDGAEVIELDEGDLDEMELDDMGDFDEAAWQPYEECIDTQLGDLESSLFGDLEDGEAIAAEELEDGEALEADDIDESSISDEDFEAFEAAWIAADEACFDLLPEDAKADAEAFQAFDQCLTDAGFSDDMGTVVYVEDGESGQSIQFGENAGTVTITGDSNGVSVATDGDVSIIDDDALEAAFEGCEELLPEDLYEVEEFDMDEGEFDMDDDGDEDGDDEDA